MLGTTTTVLYALRVCCRKQKTFFEQYMTVHSSKGNSVKMPCLVDKNTKDDMNTKDNETPEGRIVG